MSEFSLYLMSNYLEMEGQFHTSVTINNFTNEALSQVVYDPRFQAILKTMQTYDKVINSVLSEIISAYRATVIEIQPAGPPSIPTSFGNLGKILESKNEKSKNSSPSTTRQNSVSSFPVPIKLKSVRTSPTLVPSRKINSKKNEINRRSALTPNRLERNATEIMKNDRQNLTPNRLDRANTASKIEKPATVHNEKQSFTDRSSSINLKLNLDKSIADRSLKIPVEKSTPNKLVRNQTERNNTTPSKLTRSPTLGARSITPNKSSANISAFSTSKSPIRKFESYDDVMKRLKK